MADMTDKIKEKLIIIGDSANVGRLETLTEEKAEYLIRTNPDIRRLQCILDHNERDIAPYRYSYY